MDNDIRLLDVVQMKKKHPCGGFEWTVIRVGADIKIKCNICNRMVMIDRETFLKRRKKTIVHGPIAQGDGVESTYRLDEQ